MNRYEKLIKGAEDMEGAARRVVKNGHEVMAKVWLAKAKKLRALARDLTIEETYNV